MELNAENHTIKIGAPWPFDHYHCVVGGFHSLLLDIQSLTKMFRSVQNLLLENIPKAVDGPGFSVEREGAW